MFIAMPGAPLRQFASFKRIPFFRVDIEDNGKGISGEKQLAFGAKAQPVWGFAECGSACASSTAH